MTLRRGALALAVGTATAWLAVGATRWAWAGVAGDGGRPGLDAHVALGAAVAVDLVLGWVALALAATALAALGGTAGHVGRAVAERVAPATVRRTAEVVLGIGLAAGAVVPLAAASVPGATQATAAELTLRAPTERSPAELGARSVDRSDVVGALPGVDRPGYRPSTGTASVPLPGGVGVAGVAATGVPGVAAAGAPGIDGAAGGGAGAATGASTDPYADLPGIDRPASDTPPGAGAGWVPAVPPPLRSPAPPPPDVRLVVAAPGPVEATLDEVVVRRGDTLWAIAARAIGPGADVAEVAVAWPRWYAANRDAIGPDPDLIRPGTVLVPPPPA